MKHGITCFDEKVSLFGQVPTNLISIALPQKYAELLMHDLKCKILRMVMELL